MITEMRRRKYTLKKRGSQQQQTRERIVVAAMELHEELGPAGTTISAIAERAGVQRLTVYRHFPSDKELFGACTSKWFGLHPPPDLATFNGQLPERRVRAVLVALYRYYRNTESMWVAVYRDLDKVEALAVPMASFDRYLAAVREELLRGWAPRRSKQLLATVSHAVRFSTWHSLAAEQLSDAAIADLVHSWVSAAAS